MKPKANSSRSHNRVTTSCVCRWGFAHEKNSGYLPKNIGAFHKVI